MAHLLTHLDFWNMVIFVLAVVNWTEAAILLRVLVIVSHIMCGSENLMASVVDGGIWVIHRY